MHERNKTREFMAGCFIRPVAVENIDVVQNKKEEKETKRSTFHHIAPPVQPVGSIESVSCVCLVCIFYA